MAIQPLPPVANVRHHMVVRLEMHQAHVRCVQTPKQAYKHTTLPKLLILVCTALTTCVLKTMSPHTMQASVHLVPLAMQAMAIEPLQHVANVRHHTDVRLEMYRAHVLCVQTPQQA